MEMRIILSEIMRRRKHKENKYKDLSRKRTVRFEKKIGKISTKVIQQSL